MRTTEVLLVEDDACTGAFFEDALIDMNVTVRVAATAKAALGLLEAYPNIELAFVDRLLPDGDGRELCHLIKRLRPRMHLVQMSSHPVGRVDGTVVTAVLDKPFTIETLEMLVTTLTRLDAPPPRPPHRPSL